VLLQLFDEKQERMLDDLRGMFALILWDEARRRMFLARDPYGIKPLYYADDGGTLRAASQVRALAASGRVDRRFDPAGAAGFFLRGTVPEPFTMYRAIRALPAGSYCWIDGNGVGEPRPQLERLCRIALCDDHYLEAEFFRASTTKPTEYWAMNKVQRADAIWQALFVDRTPISEATRGVVAVLASLGLDPAAPTLTHARDYFASQPFEKHLTNVLKLAGVSELVMTNDPLDPEEAPLWEAGAAIDPRFHAALRLDRILNDWKTGCVALKTQGYDVEPGVNGRTAAEVRRFLEAWITRMRPRYLAVSLTDDFAFPIEDDRTRLFQGAVLPTCQSARLPMSLMIGVRRQVNPALRLAGDAVGQADLRTVERFCRDWPGVRFLVSVLSRENQHELCVYARKFANLMPFGCWWFLNNPSIVEEMTRERLEMLGQSFIPQHSDARVLEQVIYKWRSSRRSIAPALADSYRRLILDGRPVTEADVERDVTRMFRTNFTEFVG
jgi:hypothetical protein